MKQINKKCSNIHLIHSLFYDRKYEKVIKLSNELLDKNKYNSKIRYLRAVSYRAIGEYDKAISDLKYNISLNNNVKEYENSCVELYYIYYQLRMYKEAYKLLPIITEITKFYGNQKNIEISTIILKYKLRIDQILSDRYEYLRDQLLDYNEKTTLDHIKIHCIDNFTYKKSKFEKDVNVDYLFSVLRENLNRYERSNINSGLDVYFFHIDGIGFKSINNNICNVLKVLSIPETNDIISMFPISDEIPKVISILDIDYDKLFNREKTKVKVMSQIDKFNKRYSRKKY